MEGVLKSLFDLTKSDKRSVVKENGFSEKIIKDIAEVSSRLKDLETNFNCMDNDELIEAMIYEELALKSRYSYLMRIARENNISNHEFI